MSITIPKNRPITPGEIIEEEYRKAIGMTQQQFADALGISRVRYAEIAKGKRALSVDTAFRLARMFRTDPQFWLNMQLMTDIWETQHSPAAAEFDKIKPYDAVAAVHQIVASVMKQATAETPRTTASAGYATPAKKSKAKAVEVAAGKRVR